MPEERRGVAEVERRGRLMKNSAKKSAAKDCKSRSARFSDKP